MALAGIACVAQVRQAVSGVYVKQSGIERDGRYATVAMTLDLSGLKVESNRAVLLTPRLVNGSDSLILPSVGIYGRQRYYHYVRNGKSMLSGEDELSCRASRTPDTLAYKKVVDFQEWMNGARLELVRSDYGCCNTMLAQTASESLGTLVGQHPASAAFFPELVYVTPQAEKTKSRSLQGSAYIDFPVNKTVIYPDYRRNTAELGKIRATIDSVRGDSDITITSVWLKGYASPESPYSHNRELAIGRTEALKKHIMQLYRFADGILVTDYEPEDWDGLRRYVEQSALDHKQEILAIIGSDREPDNKELQIKQKYPQEYRHLLQECYPALRHTDYRISYDIRSYGSIDEIERIMRTAPQKLSLNEFYLLASNYEPGTEEFTDVFETAVRMYPDDEVANLNAANADMRRGDNIRAARYLAKAGNSPEAVYARGALAVRTGDYDTARVYLREARARGVEQAAITLAGLDSGGAR